MIITLKGADFSGSNIGSIFSDLVVTWSLGSIAGQTGQDADVDNRARTNFLKIADIDDNFTVTNTEKFIVFFYASDGSYLGELDSTTFDKAVTETTQWIPPYTTITKSMLTTSAPSATYVRIMVQNIQFAPSFVVNGVVLSKYVDANTVILNYPFSLGGIDKSTGKIIGGNTARCFTEYLALTDLGTNITVKESDFFVYCYDSSKTYLGQYDASNNSLVKNTYNFTKSTAVLVSTLSGLNVSYICIVAKDPATTNPYVYVDNAILTKN